MERQVEGRYTDAWGLSPLPQPPEPAPAPAKNWACLHEIAGVCSIFELSAEERIAAVDALLARELESEEMREEFAKAAAAYADKVIVAMNGHPELRLGEVIKQRLEEERSTPVTD